MNRFNKSLVYVFAGLALTMPSVLVSEYGAQAKAAVADAWQTEIYGVYFSYDEAQEVADAINAGNDSSWCDAAVAIYGTFNGQYTWSVTAQHYTD